MALSNATLPYIVQLAEQGFARAVAESPSLAAGVNAFQGAVTHPGVAKAQSRQFVPLGVSRSGIGCPDVAISGWMRPAGGDPQKAAIRRVPRPGDTARNTGQAFWLWIFVSGW